MDITVPVDHKVNTKESKKIERYQDLARGLKTVEQEHDGDTNCIWYFEKGTGETGFQMKNREHLDHSTALVQLEYIEESLRLEETWGCNS